MTTAPVRVVELTDEELRLVNSALHAFLSAFGHEEAEVVHAVQRLLAKFEPAPPAG